MGWTTCELYTSPQQNQNEQKKLKPLTSTGTFISEHLVTDNIHSYCTFITGTESTTLHTWMAVGCFSMGELTSTLPITFTIVSLVLFGH
jgi:hypothetical protein